MKKLIPAILISLYCLSASSSVFAEGLDTRQWDAYCKASKEHREKCTSAELVCEQYEHADCDQIKLAFMQSRSVDPVLAVDVDKAKKAKQEK